MSIAQATGDNLGVNGILGYVESFVSRHFCGYCRMHSHEMQIALCAQLEQLRNIQTYEELTRKCAWSRLIEVDG